MNAHRGMDVPCKSRITAGFGRWVVKQRDAAVIARSIKTGDSSVSWRVSRRVIVVASDEFDIDFAVKLTPLHEQFQRSRVSPGRCVQEVPQNHEPLRARGVQE